MSDNQYHGRANPDLEAADFDGSGGVGRGTGFTLKQVKECFKRWFKKNQMPNRQWKTLAQKQALLKRAQARLAKAGKPTPEAGRPVAPLNFRRAQTHTVGGGIKLKKFGKDVWDKL